MPSAEVAIGAGNWLGSTRLYSVSRMGHTSATMTRLYSGEIPLADVTAACSKAFGRQLEILETEAVA